MPNYEPRPRPMTEAEIAEVRAYRSANPHGTVRDLLTHFHIGRQRIARNMPDLFPLPSAVKEPIQPVAKPVVVGTPYQVVSIVRGYSSKVSVFPAQWRASESECREYIAKAPSVGLGDIRNIRHGVDGTWVEWDYKNRTYAMEIEEVRL